MIAEPVAEPLTLDRFQEIAVEENLMPLWMGREDSLREPKTPIVPYLWRWQHLRHRITQAKDLIPLGAKGAERRALTLRNPGVPPGRIGTTHTLVAAIQLVQGTEVAPSHRHTMSALRFIKEGEGACTIVNGEPESMDVGDLLLTPGWYWHGHFSEHTDPMIWMDGLDVPLVMAMAASFQEEFPTADREQPVIAPRDESIRRYSGGGLLPVGERTASRNSPLLNFRWAQTEERLMALKDRDGSPYDGLALEYTSPFTGGPVMPTIGCWIQMLRPGERTKAHRHTGSVIYNVVRGNGSSIINGIKFDWTAGDIFCIPSWAIHEHSNRSATEDAVLFSMNDTPTLEALGLFREGAYEDNGGYQIISETFKAI